jgi:hypothetical protein
VASLGGSKDEEVEQLREAMREKGLILNQGLKLEADILAWIDEDLWVDMF